MIGKPARIGKVRLKSGGAELRIFDRVAKDLGGENWCGKIVENARTIAGYDAEDSRLVGYFILGLFSDGSHSTAYRYDPKRSPIPRRLPPGYVTEALREDMITVPAIQRHVEDSQ